VALCGPQKKIFIALWPCAGHTLSMKTHTLKLRVSPDEKQAFQDAAGISGIALSAWMRERLRRASIRELEDTGRQIPFLRSKAEALS
jgi:hypothetical protein